MDDVSYEFARGIFLNLSWSKLTLTWFHCPWGVAPLPECGDGASMDSSSFEDMYDDENVDFVTFVVVGKSFEQCATDCCNGPRLKEFDRFLEQCPDKDSVA